MNAVAENCRLDGSRLGLDAAEEIGRLETRIACLERRAAELLAINDALTARLNKRHDAEHEAAIWRHAAELLAEACYAAAAAQQALAVELRRVRAGQPDGHHKASLIDGGWRPIETAPRDGTDVLVVWGTRPDREIAHWSESAALETKEGNGWLLTRSGGWLSRVTFWQPLPAITDDVIPSDA